MSQSGNIKDPIFIQIKIKIGKIKNKNKKRKDTRS